MIYVFIDLGNYGRRKTLIDEYEKNKKNGITSPELIIIDSMPKKSASTLNFSDFEDDFKEIALDFEFDDIDFKL